MKGCGKNQQILPPLLFVESPKKLRVAQDFYILRNDSKKGIDEQANVYYNINGQECPSLEILVLMTSLGEITFLIGNGFDIRLGLKTKFTDFYNTYIKLNEFEDDQTIKRFCAELKKIELREENTKTDLILRRRFHAMLKQRAKSLLYLMTFHRSFFLFARRGRR